MLNILPIMLLSSAQEVTHYMLNIMPITTAIMPQFIYNFIIFNDYISLVSLQPVVFCSMSLISDLLCLWENLCLILYQVGMITNCIIKTELGISVAKITK